MDCITHNRKSSSNAQFLGFNSWAHEFMSQNAQLIIRIHGKVMYLIKLKIYFYRCNETNGWHGKMIFHRFRNLKQKPIHFCIDHTMTSVSCWEVLQEWFATCMELSIIHNSFRFLSGCAPWKLIFIEPWFQTQMKVVCDVC